MCLLIFIVLLTSFGGNALATRKSQAVPFAMGGSQVSFNLAGTQLDETSTLKCLVKFRDGRIPIEINPTVTRDKLKAVCRLPPEIKSGSVDVELKLETPLIRTEILSEALIINPSTEAQVKIAENWDANKVSFTWDSEYFKQFFRSRAIIMLQALIYVSDGFEPYFTSSGFDQFIGPNSGAANVVIESRNMKKISNIRYPYFFVLKPFGTPTNIYLSSGLIAPTVAMDDASAVMLCGTWLGTAQIPFPEEEIHPCPPSLSQITLDNNFDKTDFHPQALQLAKGSLDNAVLYYEKVPTKGGHAQTCAYDTSTKNLLQQVGFIHEVSKYNSYVDNYLADMWPHMVCCMQSNNEDLCDAFYEIRPSDTGHRYIGPEKPFTGNGDPHFVTFESVKFDFMGWGEFWLIRGPDDKEFGVQGRMSPVNKGEKVSYFKAIAVRDGSNTVQVQLKEGNFQIFLNGIEFEVPPGPMTLPFDGISITIKNTHAHIRLQTGFTISVENCVSWLNVFGSGAQWNKGKGFMGLFGKFDDDPQNDLTSRDGFVVPSTQPMDLSLIHNRFGLTWMTTPMESLFVYEDFRTWEDYTKRDFGPILQYPDPVAMPEDVKAVCGESLFCYYEYVATGSLANAGAVATYEKEIEKIHEDVKRKVPMCDAIGSPTNGRVRVGGHLDGSLATYSCDKEYDFINGNKTRTCSASEAKSHWTGDEPKCIWTCTACEESMEFLLSHDPADCTKFFLCSFGERFALECPVYNYYDPVMMLCSSDYKCSGPPGCK
ncbi:Sushi domain-containing protein 2 [Pseudolycoriella hygida]|uniref:Sushi domain-containing protein 2 n=1 Tax=Pseudolycoriella hygida TaxID=35572 RepID=A0A9Q0MXH2_9DIPT|nr:Sushi domain-containing protein 2 [Pseudolycoriella hygida]